MKRRCGTLLLGLFLAGLQGWGQTADDVFNRGNELYRDGRFREAVEAYNTILNQGLVSAPLYFNLGNSQYRLGNLAESILSYERARRIDPSDPDIAFNLSLANLRTVDRIEAVPELFLVTWAKSLSGFVPAAVTEATLIGAWIGFFTVLSLLNLAPRISRERALRLAAAVLVAVIIVAGGMLALQIVQASDESGAIIVRNVVTAKASPDEQSVDTFVIHEGLKVRIQDAVGDWVRISLADGKVGWVRRTSCEVI
jgi:tetratricopeptide (TPR) repeat protein